MSLSNRIMTNLKEEVELLPGIYICNDCGREFENVGPECCCPYCGCGDIIMPTFEDSLEYIGIDNVSPLYYVTGTPEDCHTIEDADNYYDSLPDYSASNYKKDRCGISQKQYEFIDKHRKEAGQVLHDFVMKMLDSGPLD